MLTNSLIVMAVTGFCWPNVLLASEPLPAAGHGTTAPAHHWNYADTTKWNETSQVCGIGKKQSPINIATQSAVGDNSLASDKLNFDKYTGLVSGEFFNNGHTVQFTVSDAIDADKRPRINGGGLGAKGFILQQFHFHWGPGGNSSLGSEHTFDGLTYPAEIHLVHYNSKYPSFTEAALHEDGVAVVGFLFESVNDPSLVKTDYVQLTKLIANITEVDGKVAIQVDFAKLLPSSAVAGTGFYYRYDGSLTTPPCSEIVSWTVFNDRIPILASSLDSFRTATTETIHYNETSPKMHEISVELMNNFRPVQQLNNRTITTNRLPPTTTSTAQVTTTVAPTTKPPTSVTPAPAAAVVASGGRTTTPSGSVSVVMREPGIQAAIITAAALTFASIVID